MSNRKARPTDHYKVHNQHHYMKYRDEFRYRIKIIFIIELLFLLGIIIAAIVFR